MFHRYGFKTVVLATSRERNKPEKPRTPLLITSKRGLSLHPAALTWSQLSHQLPVYSPCLAILLQVFLSPPASQQHWHFQALICLHSVTLTMTPLITSRTWTLSLDLMIGIIGNWKRYSDVRRERRQMAATALQLPTLSLRRGSSNTRASAAATVPWTNWRICGSKNWWGTSLCLVLKFLLLCWTTFWLEIFDLLFLSLHLQTKQQCNNMFNKDYTLNQTVYNFSILYVYQVIFSKFV